MKFIGKSIFVFLLVAGSAYVAAKQQAKDLMRVDSDPKGNLPAMISRRLEQILPESILTMSAAHIINYLEVESVVVTDSRHEPTYQDSVRYAGLFGKGQVNPVNFALFESPSHRTLTIGWPRGSFSEFDCVDTNLMTQRLEHSGWHLTASESIPSGLRRTFRHSVGMPGLQPLRLVINDDGGVRQCLFEIYLSAPILQNGK